MRNKNLYSKTEWMLYNHFKRIRKIERLKRIIDHIERRILQIKSDIKECRYVLRDNLKGISYDTLKVNGGIQEKSQIESMLIREAVKLDQELEEARKKKYRLRRRIRDKENKVLDIKLVLEKLDDEQQQIVEMKYNRCLSLNDISIVFLCDKSTVKRKKDKIINFISQELDR